MKETEEIKYWAYKDGYLVHRDGTIYSMNYRNTGRMRRIKQKLDKDGYLYFYNKTVHRHVKSHRFVAECFHPNPDNLPEVDHINGNRADNRVENLRWVTRKQNCNNPYTLEQRSESMTNNEKNSRKVYQYTKDGDFVREWPSVSEVYRQLGFHISNIVVCCSGKLRSVHGYVWSYEKADKIEIRRHRHCKCVYQLTLDGKLVKEWPSVLEAAKELGFSRTCIGATCRGVHKSAYGFKWSYTPPEAV